MKRIFRTINQSMKSIKSYLFLAFIFISGNIFGQFTISGKVIDSASKEPLQGASVFAQNTTNGTITNKQGEFSLQLKSGGYELIISFTGYLTKQVQVTGPNAQMDIELVKEEKSMSEVVITSSNEVADGMQKYGKFFLDYFIGSTPNAASCSLQNPEVLHFFYFKKSDKLKVTATEPIVIANNALGYNLRYQLDSFVYYYKTDISSYRGYCLFSEMTGSFSDMKKWSTNRKNAYYGSKLHFMRSYYDSSLTDEGFEIAMIDEKDNKKFMRVKNPYDTTYYGVFDSTGEVEVFYPRKFSVSYKKKPEAEYLAKFKLSSLTPYSVTYLDLRDAIAIKENGFYYNQKDLVNQGYWSWKNIADLLPYDYIP